MKKIKILVVPSDNVGGIGEFRSVKPHLYLENKYPDEFSIDIIPNPDFYDDNFLKQYDIVQYHKYLGNFESTKINVDKLTAMGIVTIMDIDDYWLTDKNHPAHSSMVKHGISGKILSNLKQAKHITTTTDIFAKEISKINKNVTVIENGIDPNELQFIPNPTKSDRLRIGWLGGSTHKYDLDLLKDSFSKLNGLKLLDKVQLVLCGFNLKGIVSETNINTGQTREREILPTETSWYEYEKIFTNNYTTISPEYKAHLLKFNKEEFIGVENEPYRRVWTKSIKTYCNNYNFIDVALAPLDQTLFNSCKSQLKCIEAGFHKKALIAQNFGPYQIDLTNSFSKGGNYSDTANSILVNTINNKSDWVKHIKKLVENPDLIKSLGDNLYSDISKKYSLEVLSEKRKKLYIELVNGKK